MNDFVSSADYAGWVQKKGSVVKNWKRRFMLLRGRELAYYDTGNISASSKPKGNLSVINVELSNSINNGIIVHGTQGRVLQLHTNSVENCNLWFRYLINAAQDSLTVHKNIGNCNSSNRSSNTNKIINHNNRHSHQYSHSTTTQEDRLTEVLDRATTGYASEDSIDIDDHTSQQQPYRSTEISRYCKLGFGDTSLSLNDSVAAEEVAWGKGISKTGWLFKKGNIIKSWKKRYFALHERVISYYDSVDQKGLCVKAKGTGSVKRVEYWMERPFSLSIHFEGGKIMLVSADSQEDIKEWYTAITHAIQMENNNNLDNPTPVLDMKHLLDRPDRPTIKSWQQISRCEVLETELSITKQLHISDGKSNLSLPTLEQDWDERKATVRKIEDDGNNDVDGVWI